MVSSEGSPFTCSINAYGDDLAPGRPVVNRQLHVYSRLLYRPLAGVAITTDLPRTSLAEGSVLDLQLVQSFVLLSCCAAPQ